MRHGTLAAANATRNPSRRHPMRKPTPYVSLHDVPFDLLDGDGDDFDRCPHGGLCWPDDPLDEVISYLSVLKDGFLDALGFDSLQSLDCPAPSPSPGVSGRVGEDDDCCSKGAGAMDVDVDALAADICAAGGGKGSACDVFDRAPEHAPTVPDVVLRTCAAPAGSVAKEEHLVSCCTKSTTSSTTTPCRSLSSASCGTESAEHVVPCLSWTVQKRRRRSATVRKRPWPFALSLALMPAAGRHSHADNNDSLYGAELSRSNGGGGKRRRRSGRWHPNRSRKRTCSHCGSSETPQWRAGPEGAGTLCNACGIRYKLGKLYPEYRPSMSPFFSTDEYSNRHSNVVKLREKKRKAIDSDLPPVPATPNTGEVLRPCKYESDI